MRAFHFTGNTLRDGSPIPPIGHKLVFNGTPILCQQGYHASIHPFDALQYAPGALLHLVEVGGKVLHQQDKIVGTERTILQSIDATSLLRLFARQQALSVLHLWKAPAIVRKYLETGDENLRDAAWAARAAAWAAGDAAWAARAAAWAAEDAAWAAGDAARAAARAARAAARAAAWAAGDAARIQFLQLVNKEFNL